jgi:dsRNA-specific ribonuclease
LTAETDSISKTKRLLGESGRTSKYPVFVVGVYSGSEKLSDAYGTSLRIAEVRVKIDNLTLPLLAYLPY